MEQTILNELEQIKQLTLLGQKQALTMDDTALLTGLSKSTIYKLVCSKQIPHYKSQGGKLTYFDKDEVNRWLLQNRVATQSEESRMTAKNLMKGGSYGK